MQATLQIRWPKRVELRMDLSQVFEGHCRDIFDRHGLKTVADLQGCQELTATEIVRINAWLSRCWWLD